MEPEEIIKHKEHGESLKTRTKIILFAFQRTMLRRIQQNTNFRNYFSAHPTSILFRS
jgi:hypothetical protein